MSWISLKSTKKQDTVVCPVCDKPRNKGDHKKCSKITQLKAMKEKKILKILSKYSTNNTVKKSVSNLLFHM